MKNELLDKIRNEIEMYDSLVEYEHGNEHCIMPEHYDALAQSIVKILKPNELKGVSNNEQKEKCVKSKRTKSKSAYDLNNVGGFKKR